MTEAVPAFCVLFFIPFTYSILQGVMVGLIMYLLISICSENFMEHLKKISNGGLTQIALLFYQSCCSTQNTFVVNMGLHVNVNVNEDQNGNGGSRENSDREALLGH